MKQRIRDLAGLVLAGHNLSSEQALDLSAVSGPDLHDLFYWANRIRLERVGPDVHTCSIAAGKVGACSQDCRFCSQSAHYCTHIEHGVLDEEAIVSASREAAASGASCFGLVNSGLGPTDDEIEQFAGAMQRVAGEAGLGLCASLGVLTDAQARRLYELGVRRYNHNLQTSRRFFPRICSSHSYDQRIETIHACRRAGIQACCGGLFGMGETWADRVDLAIELRDLRVEVVPVNFLIPIAGTPLAERQPLPAMECLKIISLYRFLLPDRTIKVAGGRETCLRDLQSWIFLAGANGMLIGNYLTTCGRKPQDDLQMLADLGMLAAAEPLTLS